jgi:hypothetical protein
MIEYFWPLFPFFFAFLLAVVLVETFLSGRWIPTYFSKGISIYHHNITVISGIQRIPTAELIEATLPESGWHAPILVRQIGENQFAFREKMFHFGMAYTPLMHGYIKCDPYTGQIKIRGNANWFPVCFSFYFLMFFLTMPLNVPDIFFPMFLMGLLWFIYVKQKKRFRQVEEAIQILCEKESTNG